MVGAGTQMQNVFVLLVLWVASVGSVVSNSSYAVLYNGTCDALPGHHTIKNPWSCMVAGKTLGFIESDTKDSDGFYEYLYQNLYIPCSRYFLEQSSVASGCLHYAGADVNRNYAITTNVAHSEALCGASYYFRGTRAPMNCICFKGQVCNHTSGTKDNSEACMCGKTLCTDATGKYCLTAGSETTRPVDKCNQFPICAKANGRAPNNGSCACGTKRKQISNTKISKYYRYETNVCTENTGLYCFAEQSTCAKKSVLFSWKSSGYCNDKNDAGYIFNRNDCNSAAKDLNFAKPTSVYINTADNPPGCYQQSSSSLIFNHNRGKHEKCSSLRCLCATSAKCMFQNGKTRNSYTSHCMCGRSLCSENSGLYCSATGCGKLPSCEIINASTAVVTDCQCGPIECTAGKFCYNNIQCNTKQVFYMQIFRGYCNHHAGAVFISRTSECSAVATQAGFTSAVSEFETKRPQGCHSQQSYQNLFFNTAGTAAASIEYPSYCAFYLFDCMHRNGTEKNENGCKCGNSACKDGNEYCLASESRCSLSGPIFATTTTTTAAPTTTTTTILIPTTTTASRTTTISLKPTTTTARMTTTLIPTTTTAVRTTTTFKPTMTTLVPHMRTSTVAPTTKIPPGRYPNGNMHDRPTVQNGDSDRNSNLPIVIAVIVVVIAVIAIALYCYKKNRIHRGNGSEIGYSLLPDRRHRNSSVGLVPMNDREREE